MLACHSHACACRNAISGSSSSIFSLPEMLFYQNRGTLTNEPSGISIHLNATDALRAWREADTGAPLQVTVAKVRVATGGAAILGRRNPFLPLSQSWQNARQDEIQQQKAVQLDYDWTYTSPYAGTVSRSGGAEDAECKYGASSQAGPSSWVETEEQVPHKEMFCLVTSPPSSLVPRSFSLINIALCGNARSIEAC